jgi:Fe-S-cluster containining protein
MSNPLENELDASAGIEAGDFSAWLRATEALLRSGSGGAEVPCGDCKGCCRSSMFIHIEPAETRTLRRIPRALKFPAPGRPKGHVLMGYSDTGRCPMLAAEQCSIYEDRPQTCRDYDCRVFAATDIPVDPQAQPEIARRVSRWVFRYEDAASCKEQQSLKAVVRIHSHFPDWTDALLMGASAGSEAGMVRDLLAALNEARPADSTVD